MKPPKSILDPAFRYRPSHATDIRKTFERVRGQLEQARSNRSAAEPADKVVQLAQRGTAPSIQAASSSRSAASAWLNAWTAPAAS